MSGTTQSKPREQVEPFILDVIRADKQARVMHLVDKRMEPTLRSAEEWALKLEDDVFCYRRDRLTGSANTRLAQVAATAIQALHQYVD